MEVAFTNKKNPFFLSMHVCTLSHFTVEKWLVLTHLVNVVLIRGTHYFAKLEN